MEAGRGRRFDELFRGYTPGLKEELTDCLTRQFDYIRSLNYEVCPGEAKCESKPADGNRDPQHRIYQIRKQQPDLSIDEICKPCRYLPTKPGQEPPELSEAIATAYQIEEDDLVCGGFEYPAILDYFDPFEWVCIVAIKAARRNSENKATKPPDQADPKKPDAAHLKRLAHGY